MPVTFHKMMIVAAGVWVIGCGESSGTEPDGPPLTSPSGGAPVGTTGGDAPSTTSPMATTTGTAVGTTPETASTGTPVPDGGGARPATGGTVGTGDEDSGVSSPEPAAEPAPPWDSEADAFIWATDEFELAAGEEKYLCFAKTLEQDEVINSYWVKGEHFQHHLLFNRNRNTDPEGFEVCDVAFKSGWDTVFITGAGETALELPEDAGHILPAGTQMVLQMHLLNVKTEPVKSKLEIHMLRSKEANPRPVSTYIIGDGAIDLPANATTTIQGECDVASVELVAAFPHMHLLGSKMVLELSRGGGPFEEIFRRDPFDFDNQYISPFEMQLQSGDRTRISCTWNNTTDEAVPYGESTRQEMCYFIGFAIQDSMSACISHLPLSALTGFLGF